CMQGLDFPMYTF
nr:immunoglobulin light chain junction region [Macaca mulatta]